VFVRDLVVVLD